MGYEPTKQVRWSRSHPPRCLSSVLASPIKDSDIVEGHEAFAHFALSCTCGELKLRVLGYLPEPDLLLSPLSLRCTKCNRLAEIFDIEKHGYDAELGNGCYSRRAEGEATEIQCPKCNSSVFQTSAVVSYQMEEAELDDDDEKLKSHDLFDTFHLAISCTRCGRKEEVCDYECA